MLNWVAAAARWEAVCGLRRFTIPCICCRIEIALWMPWVAAVTEEMPWSIASLRVDRSLARLSSDWLWKYLHRVVDGARHLEAGRRCILRGVNWVLMFCNASKFCCVAVPRTILDIL